MSYFVVNIFPTKKRDKQIQFSQTNKPDQDCYDFLGELQPRNKEKIRKGEKTLSPLIRILEPPTYSKTDPTKTIHNYFNGRQGSGLSGRSEFAQICLPELPQLSLHRRRRFLCRKVLQRFLSLRLVFSFNPFLICIYHL